MQRHVIMTIACLYLWALSNVMADDEFARIMGRCRTNSTDFDNCMKTVFNDLRMYFRLGIPEYNIAPFDPHHSDYVEQHRGDPRGLGGYSLILKNVSEYGWTQSEVTKFHLDKENQKIIYSQYFPEKSLEGLHEFTGKFFGSNIKVNGSWNLTLYDYSQTTTVRRIGDQLSLLKVHVEVDRIGDLEMHIGNIFGQGRDILNNISDIVINKSWMLGFVFVKPLINDLVSSAFTDIFNESFRNFPLENFIKDS